MVFKNQTTILEWLWNVFQQICIQFSQSQFAMRRLLCVDWYQTSVFFRFQFSIKKLLIVGECLRFINESIRIVSYYETSFSTFTLSSLKLHCSRCFGFVATNSSTSLLHSCMRLHASVQNFHDFVVIL